MEGIIQNRKWILIPLVVTFLGIPILTQFLAVIIVMLGVGPAGIVEVCSILITPTIYLPFKIFMLALGASMLFFLGQVGNVPEFCCVECDGASFAVIPQIKK